MISDTLHFTYHMISMNKWSALTIMMCIPVKARDIFIRVTMTKVDDILCIIILGLVWIIRIEFILIITI